MGLREIIEDHPIVVVALAVVAAAGVSWSAAERIRIGPKDDEIAALKDARDEAQQQAAEAKARYDELEQSTSQGIKDCAEEIRKAIRSLKERTRARLAPNDVESVRKAMSSIDGGRRERILGHIPGGDWSGVAEDLISPFNGEGSATARLVLAYFPIALQAIGSNTLPEPAIEIVWPDE